MMFDDIIKKLLALKGTEDAHFTSLTIFHDGNSIIKIDYIETENFDNFGELERYLEEDK